MPFSVNDILIFCFLARSATTKIVLFLLIWGFFHSCCCGQDEQTWQQRLPVSINGKLPTDLPTGFEQKYWHSLRLSLSFSGKISKFDLERLKRRKLFNSEVGEELRNAIIVADVERIRELIKEGADVNEKGEKGITPLYLAMLVDTDPRPFEILIENGADPNIPCMAEMHIVAPLLGLGSTVCHLAAKADYNRLFSLTFRAGGNPNGPPRSRFLWGPPFRRTINHLDAIDQPDAIERLKLLAENRADFNLEYTGICRTYLANCLLVGFWTNNKVKRDRHYRMALIAIENGADFSKWSRPRNSYMGKESSFINGSFQPIHFLALSAIENNENFPEGSAGKELLDFLEKNGQSLERATGDLHRWKEWNRNEHSELIQIEHKVRLSDTTGEKLEKWQIEELPKLRTKLELDLWNRWDDPKWRIQRLPATTTEIKKVYPGQNVVWSDIVRSGVISKSLFEKWSKLRIFDEPAVESLKVAMFDRDIREMTRLIEDEEVNVNTIGKDNLTLLFMSLGIDDDPRPFELLLVAGADPNVSSDGVPEQRGLAVTHVVSKSMYCRHFKTVFESGGSPNLKVAGKAPIGHIPLECRDWEGRVRFLCEQGADIDQAADKSIALKIVEDWFHNRPSKEIREIRKKQLLVAIELGAELNFLIEARLSSPRFQRKGELKKFGRCNLELPHILLECYAPFSVRSELKSLLEAKGYSFEKAEEDLKEWRRMIDKGKSPLNSSSENKE